SSDKAVFPFAMPAEHDCATKVHAQAISACSGNHLSLLGRDEARALERKRGGRDAFRPTSVSFRQPIRGRNELVFLHWRFSLAFAPASTGPLFLSGCARLGRAHARVHKAIFAPKHKVIRRAALPPRLGFVAGANVTRPRFAPIRGAF